MIFSGFNVMVLGDSGVGKTSFVGKYMRYITGKFLECKYRQNRAILDQICMFLGLKCCSSPLGGQKILVVNFNSTKGSGRNILLRGLVIDLQGATTYSPLPTYGSPIPNKYMPQSQIYYMI